MNSYEGYLKHPAGNVITMEESLTIYTEMMASIEKCTADDKLDFYNDLIRKAAKYTEIRCSWEYMGREEKIAKDDARTAAHNKVITALNIVARLASSEGIDVSWREKLGDDRKRIGDFVCFLAYMTGICNR